MENIIYKTKSFKVIAHPQPFVDRDEGGHIKIVTSKNIKDRLDLTPSEAIELAWLTNLVGQAFKDTMTQQGVNIIKLNYQDMGNWFYKTGTPEHLHIHIFGRVLGAKHQPFPEAIYLPDRSTGFYNDFKPLTAQDEDFLTKEIEHLSKTEKYKKENWGVK